MNVSELKDSDKILFECLAGSWAYGTNTPKSDLDYRGIFLNSAYDYLGLDQPPHQINNQKQDIIYYSLRRFFELIKVANPNIIELLWMPEDCIKVVKPQFEILKDNRNLFISKHCYKTHSGYAIAQIKKSRGQNKRVHNPQPEQRPLKEDFCYYIPYCYKTPILKEINYVKNYQDRMPGRPVPLKETSLDLSKCHVAALENTRDTYRLYYYGKPAKGVFRGDDNLTCESIPIPDEYHNLIGFLIYNKDAYEFACREWFQYWDWMRNRNESRWIDQESGQLNYDQKNIMHCMRLLLSGENILRNGEPIVRFSGEQLQYLMDIRAGKFSYQDIMSEVDKRMGELDKLYETSAIQHGVDGNKLDKLYREICNA
jgi:predicted nucleotidyltransferase